MNQVVYQIAIGYWYLQILVFVIQFWVWDAQVRPRKGQGINT